MRPLSFTRNIGGFPNVYRAIRKGFVPGVSVKTFRDRCGLSPSLSFFVVEFFLCTKVQSDQEYVIVDTLIEETLTRSHFDKTLARLYFFALNLNMPGERLKEIHQTPAEIQHHVITQHVYSGNGWVAEKFAKDSELEPVIKKVGEFVSAAARRKWVNNYWYMKDQCDFVERLDGSVETFANHWFLLALRLFFERSTVIRPTDDAEMLVKAAKQAELHKLLGVSESWLDQRLAGSADMFLTKEDVNFEATEESQQERKAVENGKTPPPPPPGSPAQRRQRKIEQLIRRGDNKKFIQDLYCGQCQISGVVLNLAGGGFTVDCAHIRPLGTPHRGPDDVGNMLSLSPNVHRLLDRGCIKIDPNTLSIMLLHGNTLPHLPKLLLKTTHPINRDHLSYFNVHLAK